MKVTVWVSVAWDTGWKQDTQIRPRGRAPRSRTGESMAMQAAGLAGDNTAHRHDADYVFFELTRSICPECRRTIDAHILLRDGKVFMRKRCPDHGMFEALVYG